MARSTRAARSPLRGHRPRTAVLVAALGLATSTALLGPVSPANAAVACEVDYSMNDWGSGFTAYLTITNTGDPWDGWQLGFEFPGNQQITQGWSATWDQQGQQVTADSLDWNRSIQTGQSTMIGFNASYSGVNDEPAAFTINGTTCNGGTNQPPTAQLTSPAPGASFSAPATIQLAATASDPDGSVDRVEFLQGSTQIGVDDTAPYSFTWTDVPAGDYSLAARAVDDAGASAVSTAVDITVEADTGPAVAVSQSTLAVPEDGEASFSVTLSEQPAANVTVTTARTSGDTDLTVASGASLTFTSSTWDDPQQVTLAAAEDADSSAGSAVFTSSATGHASGTVTATEVDNDGGGENEYTERFIELYNDLKDPANGYFSPEGVPYHSVETLLVEAPDHGHQTTSEAFSYLLWLEAIYGRVTGDWQPFNDAWETTEQYIIPATADQPTNSFYNPGDPATYAPEWNEIENYPTPLDSGVSVGTDPLANELSSTYNTDDIYGMHWLLDVDNTYGFGRCGDGTTRPAYINTYQRGAEESVFETVPHPSCETFDFGGPNGYLDLFIDDAQYAQQWRYTNAPDADARAVQVAYWALTWATEQGQENQIAGTVANAAKMGDYLRYAMYDKYFKQPGCTSPSCPAGSGKNSSHYLMSWYYAWGGATDANAGWAWRIGSSHNHFGYQNPVAAWALSTVPELRPQSQSGADDWATSLTRQIQFYKWLQSDEGAIAGGATNSWEGHYGTPPGGLPTFFGMTYDWQPVYHDPPSSQWFGFQAWSMERVAEYYYITGDTDAEALLDSWVDWAMQNTTIASDGTYQIPSTLTWSGQPAGDWDSPTGMPPANPGLHVTVEDHTADVGVTGAFAKTLAFWAAGSGDTAARDMSKALLDGMWQHHRDSAGVAVTETREDYDRFNDPVYIPPGWTGQMPNGDVINSDSTFMSIRSFYQSDQDWPEVQAYLNGTGPAPTFTYHRFWAQVDVATALAEYGRLFD